MNRSLTLGLGILIGAALGGAAVGGLQHRARHLAPMPSLTSLKLSTPISSNRSLRNLRQPLRQAAANILLEPTQLRPWKGAHLSAW